MGPTWVEGFQENNRVINLLGVKRASSIRCQTRKRERIGSAKLQRTCQPRFQFPEWEWRWRLNQFHSRNTPSTLGTCEKKSFETTVCHCNHETTERNLWTLAIINEDGGAFIMSLIRYRLQISRLVQDESYATHFNSRIFREEKYGTGTLPLQSFHLGFVSTLRCYPHSCFDPKGPRCFFNRCCVRCQKMWRTADKKTF